MDDHQSLGSNSNASDSTPQPPVSTMGPPKRKNRSEVWDHFTLLSDESKSAKCFLFSNLHFGMKNSLNVLVL
ncbi:hypothetical protein TSUD_419580 [Trifolium subterraneum]|uniref:BED-type domain-containing protein n=1 Tax=Trifolium subterraneum TaxID=3900 RepID=A0A1B5Z918_TRISU|nr:hypothetical protein TSUD_419580 [Trifolium subterraneum]